MAWPLSLITINDTDDIIKEDESTAIHKIGPDYNAKLLPVEMWSVSEDNILMCLYQLANKTHTLVLYNN